MDLGELKIEPDGDGCRVGLRVKPGARRARITGVYGERLKIEVKAAPEKGRANDAVCELLADVFEVPRARVAITAGHTSRDKTARLEGLSVDVAVERLSAV